MKANVTLSDIQFEVQLDLSDSENPIVKKVSLGGMDFTKFIFDNELHEEIVDKLGKEISNYNYNQKQEHDERIRDFYTK